MDDAVQYVPREGAMINHVRTLLMNQPRGSYRVTDPGEEYISPRFIAAAWPVALQLFRNTLFGTRPDRLFINFRMRQIMQLLHSTELAADITKDDSRLTYLPFRDDMFADVFAVTIDQPTGQEAKLTLLGQPVADEYNGRTTSIWNLVIGEDTVDVTPMGAAIVTVPIRDSTIVLPGTSLRVATYMASSGMTARITVRAKPMTSISTLLGQAITVIGGRGIETVFPFQAAERVQTWKRVFLNHPATVMRQAAFLLGLAEHVNRLPREATSV